MDLEPYLSLNYLLHADLLSDYILFSHDYLFLIFLDFAGFFFDKRPFHFSYFGLVIFVFFISFLS